MTEKTVRETEIMSRYDQLRDDYDKYIARDLIEAGKFIESVFRL